VQAGQLFAGWQKLGKNNAGIGKRSNGFIFTGTLPPMPLFKREPHYLVDEIRFVGTG
jgi:hypothetical protein